MHATQQKYRHVMFGIIGLSGILWGLEDKARDAPIASQCVRWTLTGEHAPTPCVHIFQSTPSLGTAFLLPGKGNPMTLRLPFLKSFAEQIKWEVYSLDWQGQGEAGRSQHPPEWIAAPENGFDAYLEDVQALLLHAEQHHSPRPWVCVGRSLGGHIALRVQQEKACFDGMVLHAPVVAPQTGTVPLWCAKILVQMICSLGWSHAPLPTWIKKAHEPPVSAIEFYKKHPNYESRRITFGWVLSLFESCNKLIAKGIRSFQIPMLVFLGKRDKTVDNAATTNLLGELPLCQILMCEEGHLVGHAPPVAVESPAQEFSFLEDLALSYPVIYRMPIGL